jgi:predicted secreted protein
MLIIGVYEGLVSDCIATLKSFRFVIKTTFCTTIYNLWFALEREKGQCMNMNGATCITYYDWTMNS